jgi:16S rRNA (cytosine967-C5)-methyltransferase
MERVPQHAAVHESVNLARHFGHQGTARLVNGILRSLLRQHTACRLPDAAQQPAEHLAVAYSHPQWLVERWLRRSGWERTRTLCEVNNRPSGITLRPNALHTSREALAHRLQQEGVHHIASATVAPQALIVQGTDRLDRLPSYADGWFQVQDEGAMLVAPLCRPEPGQQVLDACAAPGGKTTHLAQLMRDSGRIVALDVQPGRLNLLRRNVQRLRLSSIVPIAADAAGALPVRQRFDRILVDAPCSGLGVLRRHPDIKWRKSVADLEKQRGLQLRLLHQMQKSLAHDGGLMVYSVCSNEPEETHEVVAQFLREHPHMRLEAIEPSYPQPLPMPSATSGTLDLTPDQLGTEGVFVARFRSQPETS